MHELSEACRGNGRRVPESKNGFLYLHYSHQKIASIENKLFSVFDNDSLIKK